jgi:hypothetical protein
MLSGLIEVIFLGVGGLFLSYIGFSHFIPDFWIFVAAPVLIGIVLLFLAIAPLFFS